MKRIYESFEEIAESFRDGYSYTHQLSNHSNDECFAWQHGVIEFAKFLDQIGLKLTEDTEIYKKLWDSFESFKPCGFKKCTKKETK